MAEEESLSALQSQEGSEGLLKLPYSPRVRRSSGAGPLDVDGEDGVSLLTGIYGDSYIDADGTESVASNSHNGGSMDLQSGTDVQAVAPAAPVLTLEEKEELLFQEKMLADFEARQAALQTCTVQHIVAPMAR